MPKRVLFDHPGEVGKQSEVARVCQPTHGNRIDEPRIILNVGRGPDVVQESDSISMADKLNQRLLAANMLDFLFRSFRNQVDLLQR